MRSNSVSTGLGGGEVGGLHEAGAREAGHASFLTGTPYFHDRDLQAFIDQPEFLWISELTAKTVLALDHPAPYLYLTDHTHTAGIIHHRRLQQLKSLERPIAAVTSHVRRRMVSVEAIRLAARASAPIWKLSPTIPAIRSLLPSRARR